ncbi:hypothetical protein T440DRAFT_484011 [Plenodomus tracheiphilus IPT5]|uniref:Uncharacterized protein n=1 Tax=Plenodomus tracheiphilus IPT5 TaxID=1408161 RepID=A0A6A7AR44_9PLEO|nr:hypothetical protein T440DRAFT_484011 [Plenodomus tracheiphilus IPT5]
MYMCNMYVASRAEHLGVPALPVRWKQPQKAPSDDHGTQPLAGGGPVPWPRRHCPTRPRTAHREPSSCAAMPSPRRLLAACATHRVHSRGHRSQPSATPASAAAVHFVYTILDATWSMFFITSLYMQSHHIGLPQSCLRASAHAVGSMHAPHNHPHLPNTHQPIVSPMKKQADTLQPFDATLIWPRN